MQTSNYFFHIFSNSFTITTNVTSFTTIHFRIFTSQRKYSIVNTHHIHRVNFQLYQRPPRCKNVEARPSHRTRGEDEDEAETSRQERGTNVEARPRQGRGRHSSRQGRGSTKCCLEVPRGKAFASRTTSLVKCHCGFCMNPY